MIHFKNKNGEVFAYYDSDIKKAERIGEIEALKKDMESEVIIMKSEAELKREDISRIESQIEQLTNDDGHTLADIDELSERLIVIREELGGIEHNIANSEYSKLECEYNSIPSVFFEIRENVSNMEEMTAEEVELHSNPPISKEQHVAEAEQKKQLLLAEASSAIAPLFDAVDLDMATNEEIDNLKAWKKYRVLLNRVDTSLAPDIKWPEEPTK